MSSARRRRVRRQLREGGPPQPDDWYSVLLVGGPFDRAMVRVSQTPLTMDFGNAEYGRHTYGRVDDPDTGAYLGAYAWIDPEEKT